MILILNIIAVGIGATLFIDIWVFLLRLFNIKSLDYRILGRWILSFFNGKFFHKNILAEKSIPGELLTGWTAHYLIGVSFSFLLLFIYGKEWFNDPSIYSALLTGLLTLVAPLFIMQPAFGFGIASFNLPNPFLRILKSLFTHLIYGSGLYVSAWCFILFFL